MGASGTVELSVTGDGDGERTPAYTLTLSDRQAKIEERGAERPDARISGDRSAWIDAFSPDRDRARLSVSGDAELAHQALDGLMCAANEVGAQRALA